MLKAGRQKTMAAQISDLKPSVEDLEKARVKLEACRKGSPAHRSLMGQMTNFMKSNPDPVVQASMGGNA